MYVFVKDRSGKNRLQKPMPNQGLPPTLTLIPLYRQLAHKPLVLTHQPMLLFLAALQVLPQRLQHCTLRLLRMIVQQIQLLIERLMYFGILQPTIGLQRRQQLTLAFERRELDSSFDRSFTASLAAASAVVAVLRSWTIRLCIRMEEIQRASTSVKRNSSFCRRVVDVDHLGTERSGVEIVVVSVATGGTRGVLEGG